MPLAAGPVSAWADRLTAAFFVAAGAAALIALIPLEPDRKGYDTHTQLGLEPCGWPTVHGMPCPTCGCTTAACHVVHGSLIEAFVVQPFGAALALSGLLLSAHALLCLVRGRSFVDLFVRIPFARIVAGAGVLLLASWGYKCATFAG
ncbi:MAG: DUF2752 domain-containing protein [Planctomycetes bacterium]|nr:DUF2752 domain-containing protein [Planctomycetota bacterium]